MHLFKRNENVCPQKDLYRNVYSSFICNNPNFGTTQMSITGECINKLWHIHTIESYSAVKRNKLPMCPKAWMSIRNIPRNERSQAHLSTSCTVLHV